MTNVHNSDAASPTKSILEVQVKLTELALDVAIGFDIELDFSHNSIRDVESILGKVHQQYRNTRSEDGLNGIALEFGAYIATTIQRCTGEGALEADHSQYGKGTFPFHYSGGTIFPYMWCIKRIYDGEGGNVWVKYNALVLKTVGPNAS